MLNRINPQFSIARSAKDSEKNPMIFDFEKRCLGTRG